VLRKPLRIRRMAPGRGAQGSPEGNSYLRRDDLVGPHDPGHQSPYGFTSLFRSSPQLKKITCGTLRPDPKESAPTTPRHQSRHHH
jgi:hypothetical protein